MSRWINHVRNRRHDALSRVDWRDFERLLADHYRRQGWRVDHCGTAAGASRFDGGIDIKLFRDDAYVVVQCKHWNARQVTHNAVHELAGITLTERATGAILVTSGEFTRHAIASAAKLGNMQLVDGDALRGMLGYVPEPQSFARPVEDRASRILAEVGQRVLHATEDRIRSGSRGRPGRVATAFFWGPVVEMVLILFVGLAFIVFAARVLSSSHLLGNRPAQATMAPSAEVAGPLAAEPLVEPPLPVAQRDYGPDGPPPHPEH